MKRLSGRHKASTCFITFVHVKRCDKVITGCDRLAGVKSLIERKELCYSFFTLLLIGKQGSRDVYEALELATLQGFFLSEK